MGLSPGAIHHQPCQMQRQPDTAQSPFLISPSFFPCPKRSWSQPSCSLRIQLLIHRPRRQLMRDKRPNPGHTQEQERLLRAELKPLMRVKQLPVSRPPSTSRFCGYCWVTNIH